MKWPEMNAFRGYGELPVIVSVMNFRFLNSPSFDRLDVADVTASPCSTEGELRTKLTFDHNANGMSW